ncbi:MAG: hypothetical protein JRH11_09100, partial [Deltaproteobacteria bacterium]|nr:hypothetical protein [Deltaproteobacteria bacterium]
MKMLRVPILEELQHQRALRHLVVTESADFREIRGLDQLEVLDAFCRATDFDALGTLTGLRWLRFKPNDEGQVRQIAGLPRLEHLDVLGGYLEQPDLEVLAGMTQLRSLSLRSVGSRRPLDLACLSNLRN